MNKNAITPNILRGFTLIAAVVALGLFTGLTLGWFEKSDSEIVTSTAKADDFKNTTYFVIIPREVTRSSKAKSIATRMADNATERVICGLTESQFTKLAKISQTKNGSAHVDNHNVFFISLDRRTDSRQVDEILGTKKFGTAICKNITNTSTFFFGSPMSISLKELDHEPVVT